MKNIYELDLNETIQLNEFGIDTLIRRVPGGWLYTVYSRGNDMGSTVFVPYNDEFIHIHTQRNMKWK